MNNSKRNTICVSDRDLRRMRDLMTSALNIYGGVTLEYARILRDELREARVFPASHMPSDVVALNSRVWATDIDSGAKMALTLVIPEHADASEDRISVISPLGMALFGYQAGDRLEWGPPHRLIRLTVDRVARMRDGAATDPAGMPATLRDRDGES